MVAYAKDPTGEEIRRQLYQFLFLPENISNMEQKVAENLPPVLGIEQAIYDSFPDLFVTNKSSNYWLSEIGKIVRKILKEHGYDMLGIRKQQLRLNHGAKLYSSGMMYKKK